MKYLQISSTNLDLVNFLDDNFILFLILSTISFGFLGVRLFMQNIKEREEEEQIISRLKKEGKKIYEGSLYFFNIQSVWSSKSDFVSGTFYEEDDKFINLHGEYFYKNALRKTSLKAI